MHDKRFDWSGQADMPGPSATNVALFAAGVAFGFSSVCWR